MVTTITQTTAAGLYRAGWRTYELRARRRVLATIRRRGILRTRFEVDLDDDRLSATLHWGGDLEILDESAHLVARSTNLAHREVDVRIRERAPIRLARSLGRGRWTASAAGAPAALRLAAPAPWRGRPVVTIGADEDTEIPDDPLLLVVGCCLVLAYRSLTAGLVTGRWSRDGRGPST